MKNRSVFIFGYTLVSAFILLYMLFPGPKSIKDFSVLPNSVKSKLSGDTVQIPNIVAYYSNNYRDLVIPFYIKNYQNITFLPFIPIRLNYPPEFAFSAIKDQTMSTYLEELVYPLRESIFINGWEPLDVNGLPRYKGASAFGVEGINYNTKVTLRYYPSHLIIRLIVWCGINLSVIGLFKSLRAFRQL